MGKLSPLASASATRAVLEAHGLTAKYSLGQNFLVNDDVLKKIVALAEVGENDRILEVGPGIGTLTMALLQHAGRVVSVERDPDLPAVLAETLAPWADRFALVQKDALDLTVDDLRDALDRVNNELERKLLNKFRDQAMTDVLADLEKTRTKVLERLLKRVDDGQKQQFAGDFNRMFDKMKAGEDWQADEEAIRDKYGIGDLWDEIARGATAWIYRGVTGNIKQLSRAVGDYNEGLGRIDLLYGAPVPAPTTTPAPDGNTVSDGSGGRPFQQLSAALGGGTGRSSSAGVFDLDSVAVNEKGTAAYSAITSKLGRVKLAGLTAAASLGLAAASPAATQAAALPGGEETTAVDTRDYDEGHPRITADKFCDQIVINIASADGQGLDEIREKIMDVLMEVTDGQA